MVVLGLVLTGCGDAPRDQPPIGQVTGVITLDGKPLSEAIILFQPTHGRPSIGKTNLSGRYELDYNATTKGAKIGIHTITITTHRDGEPGNPANPGFPEVLPARYHSRTELTADVTSGRNTIPFNLHSQ